MQQSAHATTREPPMLDDGHARKKMRIITTDPTERIDSDLKKAPVPSLTCAGKMTLKCATTENLQSRETARGRHNCETSGSYRDRLTADQSSDRLGASDRRQ